MKCCVDLVSRRISKKDEGVAVVGPEVRHPAVDDDLHDLARAAEGRERQSAADRLGQGDEVGLDLEALGRAGGASQLVGEDGVRRVVGAAATSRLKGEDLYASRVGALFA